MNQDEIQKELASIEQDMASAEFWNNKDEAQKTLKKYQELKELQSKNQALLRGSATLSIFTGAGGDDAEDFTSMLLQMYSKYALACGWQVIILDENKNTLGGYRNVTLEIAGKGVYGNLLSETGVHRLIRNSPFNSKGLRQTSFCYVEVLPVLSQSVQVNLNPSDLEITFAKSSGPGGQNVNKRETAVRVIHLPTGYSVHVESERSQERNREKAIEMIKSKLYTYELEKAKAEKEGYVPSFNKGTEIEWGSQRRTYTLHPYKLVKDHLSGVETSDVEGVLSGTGLAQFLNSH